ncbi:MAG: diphthamide biosynthesis enzyme Dph2 [Nitrososphaerota archaeon]
MYRIDFEKLDEWIRENNIQKVLIQAPLGLRLQLPLIVKYLREKKIKPIISTGKCWGACDVAYMEAKAIGADGIIHMGHAGFANNGELPVFYMECRITDPKPLLDIVDKIPEAIGEKKTVGIGATIQWIDFLDLFLEKLEEKGVKCVIGRRSRKTPYRGQVVGCEYACLWSIIDEIDCSIIIGSRFHGVGASITTPKPVYVVDPEMKRLYEVNSEAEEILKRRYAWIQVFKNSNRIGVLISTKPGQKKFSTAVKLKSILEECGKEADLLTVDELNVDQLDNLPYEAYVNTACPRLSIEDQMKFRSPLLLPSETLIACGRLRWENTIYCRKYLIT